ncbi:MAG: FliG C-terminal domain-containing protein [Gemmatimonadota bacterium]
MDEALTRALGLLASGLPEPAQALLVQLLPPAVRPPAGAPVPEPRTDGEAELIDYLAAPASRGHTFAAALLAEVVAGSEPRAAAALLQALPLSLQAAAAARAATASPLRLGRGLSPEQAELIGGLRAALGRAAEWGAEGLCAALRALDDHQALRALLAAVEGADTAAAAVLQTQLYGVGDLLRLDDVELQLLLSRIDNHTLALALSQAGEAVRDRLLEGVSERRSRLLRDDVELYAGAEEEEVRQAQGHLLATARHLYEKGDIRTYLGSWPRQVAGATAGEEVRHEEAPSSEAGTPPAAPRKVRRRRRRRRPPWPLALGGALLVAAAVALLWPQESGGPSERVPDSPAPGSRAPVSGPRVLVEPARGARGSNGDERPGPRVESLAPGESYAAPDVRAVLQFPDLRGRSQATAELDPEAEVRRLDPETDGEGEPAGLYLRLGKVRVTAVADGFEVRTPVVRFVAEAGSVFWVRVTLDATAEANVESGRVRATPTEDGASTRVMTAGAVARFRRPGG